MEKVYRFKNGIIYVTLPKSCDREKLKKVTEDFLKKAINKGVQNGYSNSSGDIREKQILHR